MTFHIKTQTARVVIALAFTCVASAAMAQYGGSGSYTAPWQRESSTWDMEFRMQNAENAIQQQRIDQTLRDMDQSWKDQRPIGR